MKSKFYSLITVLALIVSTFVLQGTPSPATAADYSASLNTTTSLSGYSVNSSITGTVRVLLRTDNPSGQLSVTSFSNVWGIRNTANYSATTGSSTLGTAGQMIGLVGSVSAVNAALSTLHYRAPSAGTDSITVWASNGSEYLPIPNGTNMEFHYFVTQPGPLTPAQARTYAASIAQWDGQPATTFLATVRTEAENLFATQLVAAVNYQAWVSAEDSVTEGVWKWIGPDADGVQFWSGDMNGSAVNGEFWDWQRNSASGPLTKPRNQTLTNCLMILGNNSYGLVRRGDGSGWYGWHDGQCGYAQAWVLEGMTTTKPAGQNTTVSGALYSMTPAVTTVTVATPPDQPTSVTANNNSNGNADLTWLAPSNSGSNPLTDYTIQYSQSSTFASGVSTWSHTASTQTSASISGLTAGATYYFRVAAVTSMAGAYSSTANLTLPRLPSAPQNFTATPGDQIIDLSWSAPSDNGGSTITGYKVEYKQSSSGTWNTASSNVVGTTYQLTSLTNGTNYDVRVSANNGFWGTLASLNANMPFGAVSNTSVPTIGGANAGGEIMTGADGTWSINGAAVTSTTYQWQTRASLSDPWTNIPSATNTAYTLTSGDVGKYIRLQVSKTNGANGNAYVVAYSASSSVIQSGLASTPGNLTPLFGNQSIQVSWSIPADNGGTISAIRVEYSLDGDNWTLSQSVSASTTSHTITGLTNGTSYFVRVTAVTAAGNGAYAISAEAVIPATSPSNTSVPTISGQTTYGSILSAAAGSWSANGRTLGAANYQWQASSDSGTTWTDITGETSDQLTLSGYIGSTIRVKVTRTNAVGSTIAYSTATSAVTASAPTGPQNLSVVPGDQTLAVSWAAPTNTGGVSLNDYQIQYSSNAVTWTTVSRTASLTTSQQISGLTNGTSYYVRVRALNGLNGAWAFSGTTQAPRGIPIVVTAPSISGSSQFQQLLTAALGQWNSNGSSITSTGYQWQTSVDGNTWTDIAGATTNEYRVTASVGNLVRLKVTQTNGAGSTQSITTATSAIAAVNAPAPAIVLRDTGDSQFTLRWSAPAHNGGVSLTGYTVEYSTDQVTWTSVSAAAAATEAVIAALTNGQSYYARVRAETDRHCDWSTVIGPIRPAAPVVPVVETPARGNTPSTVSIPRQPSVSTPVVSAPTSVDWSALQTRVMPVPLVQAPSNSTSGTAPVVTSDGRLELTPAETVILINGSYFPNAEMVTQGSEAFVQTDQTQFKLVFAQSAGFAVQGDAISFSGSGFTPSSPLVIWIQSTPTKLKEVTTNISGTQSTKFVIPENLTPGKHTLQINGVDSNGNIVSLAYGITVEEPSSSASNNLQTEAVDATWIWISSSVILLLLVALGIYFTRKRRQS